MLQSGITPLAVEYVETSVIEASPELGLNWPAKKGVAHLIITVNGMSEDEVYQQAEQVSAIVEKYNAIDTLMAETGEEQAAILENEK